jgi:hypothetical protein
VQSRFVVLTLILCLWVAVVACNKKTDQSTNPANTPPTSSATPAAAAPEQPKIETITIPEGTPVAVRLTQSVGSKISQAGQSFSATLADPIQVNGRTVVPSGAAVTGTIVDAKPLGRFKGGAALELQLTSIAVHGEERPIQTASLTQTAKGKGKRTAVLAGGAAGLGALIGGLAGGGKGAAIGAATGAGGGAAGAAFTGNKDIVLPAESALSFTLSQPLSVKERE